MIWGSKKNCNEDTILAIAANNSEHIENEAVYEGEARHFASEIGAIFASTSTIDLNSINSLFKEIVKKYIDSENITFKDDDDCQYQTPKEKKILH